MMMMRRMKRRTVMAHEDVMGDRRGTADAGSGRGVSPLPLPL